MVIVLNLLWIVLKGLHQTLIETMQCMTSLQSYWPSKCCTHSLSVYMCHSSSMLVGMVLMLRWEKIQHMAQFIKYHQLMRLTICEASSQCTVKHIHKIYLIIVFCHSSVVSDTVIMWSWIVYSWFLTAFLVHWLYKYKSQALLVSSNFDCYIFFIHCGILSQMIDGIIYV